jgi:hypothetical protein
VYKSTSAKHNHLNRTGSSATVPRRTGDANLSQKEAVFEVDNLGLRDAEQQREDLLIRWTRLATLIQDEGNESRRRALGKEHHNVQLNLSLLKRHIKELSRRAHVLNLSEKWNLALEMVLDFPTACKVVATRSGIEQFIIANGYPPADKRQLDDFLADESGERNAR